MKTISIVLTILTGSMFILSANPKFVANNDATNARGSTNAHSPRYSDDGQLIRPEGWRKWIYIGTPLTPHDMNNGQAAFPEFHNVYMDPESFATFERSGEFPNGTQLVKELVLVGSKKAVSGNGYFMGDFAGLEVAIKDTERFKEEPGGWAYFSFGHKAEYEKLAKAFPTASCNSCHAASADTDFVFTQYYPVLSEAMPNKKRMEMESKKQSSKKMDNAAMQSAMSAMGGSEASNNSASADEYAKRVFKWLQDKKYRGYRSESRVHPSSSGPAVHGDVKIFVNKKLDDSMKAGNKSHPIGSMSVKELYKEGNHIGWALSLKAKEDDGKGNGWYWYENLSLTDGSKPIAASIGNVNCVGCHAPGKDFIRISEIR